MIQPGSILDQGAGNLGGSARLSTADTQGTLLRLEARDSCKPCLVTLSFDHKTERGDVAPLPVNLNHLIQAEIKWASKKGDGFARVDVLHGTRVTLECSSLSVDVFMVSAIVGVALIATPMTVSASVGAGSIGKGPSLTFTTDSRLVVVGVDTTWRVPNYARAVEIQSSADPTLAIPNGFRVQVQSSDNLAGARLIGQFAAANARVTLGNGAEAIRLFNAGPLDTMYTPVFHLTL